MSDMYHSIERLHTLYGLLQDEQSKEIFQVRFAHDMRPSAQNILRLALLSGPREPSFLGWTDPPKEVLMKLNQKHEKIILYGLGATGQGFARMLQYGHIDFYGFCGQDAEKFPDGLLGKPVLSPNELVAHRDEYYVIPAVSVERFYTEISEFLQKHHYPEDHILDWKGSEALPIEKQYFEFPELYRRGTAFVDGGCYNCGTSYRFAKWCEGAYSSIIAFEPDPDNYAECCEMLRGTPLPNCQLINAGLSSREGTAIFDAQNSSSSYILPVDPSAKFNFSASEIKNKISVRTVAIDDIVGDRTVGFIKMDIEGAEFDALHGAKNTILRDKPLLAICVYHLRGDLFAIMDYLNQLLPEYRFLLRHYSQEEIETVLYASVDL